MGYKHLNIDEQRLKIVNERKRIGDWESDTVVGQGKGSYFANAYHSWERGTNENTNGLLRQFFPKGTDFHQVSQWLLDKVEKLLNNRPRKCLNYRTPAEVFWRRKICCASG